MEIDQIIIYLRSIQTRDNSTTKVEEVKASLQKIKKKQVDLNNQSEAKKLWCFEQILKIQVAYLKAYDCMKLEDFYKAWCILEQCELALRFLESHFQIGNDEYFLDFINKHVERYQSLFPYKIFTSPEILETEKVCNICGKKISIRNPCGHETGEIYSGEMCIRRVTKWEGLGISLVERPLQKYSVPFTIDKKTGKTIDQYNYSVLKYLIKRLQSPFDSWNVHRSKRRHPHSKFRHIGRNDKCPCGSGKKYKKCCLNESGVLKDHHEFEFSVPPPPELQNIEYSY